MDMRFSEFEPIRILKNLPECDLLANPLLSPDEREFAAKFYEFLDQDLDNDIKALEYLNYQVEVPTEKAKADIVIQIMQKLAMKGYYSVVLDPDKYAVGKIMRNALIAFALCGGKWSEDSGKYIGGNWPIEMGRLAGGTLFCNPVNFKANDYQRENFLMPVARDGEVASSAMTEFEAGSDIARMELRMEESGDELVLYGKKIFITNGPIAKYILVYGRLDDGRLGATILDVNDPKTEHFLATRLRTYGMEDAFVSRLVFDGVHVPKENLLEGDGLDIAFHQLTEERLVISAEALGDVAKKLLYSHSYAIERSQFGHHLNEYQSIRFPISNMVRQLKLLTDSLIYSARMMDSLSPDEVSKDMARQAMGLKVATTELAFEASIHCFRTMGGRGFIRQYSVPIGFLDAYCMIHGGGSNYVLSDSESRQIFKGV
ncbi:MAG TPA: acyl-CoA dehydrogenase [Candidatus Lokiarchaeia archaeon]|nr:acyl-CoA dehydrogenase [Candidatus Lokiarchaeia archaeon]